MIDIAELAQYFPDPDKPVNEGPYTFTISLNQNEKEETFIVNLKIQQEDNKEDHLIKFRIGLGKDKKTDSKVHKTHKPHFEIVIYKREKDAFSATAYFTFEDATDEELMNYAKGTVVIISKIIDMFFDSHKLKKEIIEKIIYEESVLDELSKFELCLIESLYDCYKRSDIVVKQAKETITIKTEHNLQKYLDVPDLAPLYLPLLKKVKEAKK